MRFSLPYFILILLCLQLNGYKAQETREDFDEVYNMDPELYNGIIFSEIFGRTVDGTQFFVENTFRRNDLGLITKSFDDQYINYDVYHQKLLLTYLDIHHAQKMVEIPIENISYFYIGDSYFEVLLDPDNNYKIYQVYNFKDTKILVYWLKYMKQNSGVANNTFRFSDLKKQIWILQKDEYYRVKNNKEFTQYLPEEEQLAVQKWMKANKVKIQKAEEILLIDLVNYINEL